MPGTESDEQNMERMAEIEPDWVQLFIEKVPFKIRPTEERLKILQKGRPTPKLLIVKRDHVRNCNRKFQESWYHTHKWLCGSTSYNKLYCWPCLLMRPETSSWCSTGTDDIKRLSTMTSKHALSKAHIKALKEYDENLFKFGLPSEFSADTIFKQEHDMNFSESDDEGKNQHFLEQIFVEQSSKRDQNFSNEMDASSFLKEMQLKATSRSKKSQSSSSSGAPVSFKTWQELNQYPLKQEDKKLIKLKRKLVRREIRNAELTNEKLVIELDLLKAKLEYQNYLNNELNISKSCSNQDPVNISEQTFPNLPLNPVN